MFLFTNAPVGTRESGAAATVTGRAAASTANGTVIEAIREGAQSSGVGFDYLLATAKRESALDPSAKATTSSATGLYQFIEQTWLGVMKNAEPKLGLSTYSDAITVRPDGSYAVSDPSARQAILDLRRDPRVSAVMAGALTQKNRETLGTTLGREPTSGDLYAAHVLGAKGASTLISTAQASPARTAAIDMPEAAAANRSLFYDKAGRPRGAAELYALLSTSTAEGKVAVAGASSVPEVATSYASLDSSLRSLFQTDRRQGAISEGVAKLWQGRAASTEPTRSAPTYFPRSDPSEETTVPVQATAVDATSAPSSEAIVVPLPPRRPASLSAPAAAPIAENTKRSVAPAALGRNLFDLSTYRIRNGS